MEHAHGNELGIMHVQCMHVHLRRDCLIRDRRRCVISRIFDRGEAIKRVARDGDEEAQDDEGKLLRDESGTFAPLEVAHIIPHSLMTIPSGMLELVRRLPVAWH